MLRSHKYRSKPLLKSKMRGDPLGESENGVLRPDPLAVHYLPDGRSGRAETVVCGYPEAYSSVLGAGSGTRMNEAPTPTTVKDVAAREHSVQMQIIMRHESAEISIFSGRDCQGPATYASLCESGVQDGIIHLT
jgi:hypothetical protein